MIDANEGVRVFPIADPDDNKVALVGNLRVEY